MSDISNRFKIWDFKYIFLMQICDFIAAQFQDSYPIVPIYHFEMRSGIWGDRSSIGADQCKSFVIFIQISLTPGQVATDVCQALEYSTWKAHVHINQRIPTPVSKELLSEDILRMAHTVHSVPLSIFRAQGPPDSLLSSCDPPF